MNFVPECIKSLPLYMDYEGQKQAEKLFQIIVTLFAIVGFGWGYMCQQFSQTVMILGAGFALACLLVLPPWPMYRKHALPWQKARAFPDDGCSVAGGHKGGAGTSSAAASPGKDGKSAPAESKKKK